MDYSRFIGYAFTVIVKKVISPSLIEISSSQFMIDNASVNVGIMASSYELVPGMEVTIVGVDDGGNTKLQVIDIPGQDLSSPSMISSRVNLKELSEVFKSLPSSDDGGSVTLSNPNGTGAGFMHITSGGSILRLASSSCFDLLGADGDYTLKSHDYDVINSVFRVKTEYPDDIANATSTAGVNTSSNCSRFSTVSDSLDGDTSIDTIDGFIGNTSSISPYTDRAGSWTSWGETFLSEVDFKNKRASFDLLASYPPVAGAGTRKGIQLTDTSFDLYWGNVLTNKISVDTTDGVSITWGGTSVTISEKVAELKVGKNFIRVDATGVSISGVSNKITSTSDLNIKQNTLVIADSSGGSTSNMTVNNKGLVDTRFLDTYWNNMLNKNLQPHTHISAVPGAPTGINNLPASSLSVSRANYVSVSTTRL